MGKYQKSEPASNTLLPLPRKPPSETLRKAQEERAKIAKKSGQAINRQADAEKAAKKAAARAVNKATSHEPVTTSKEDGADAGAALGNAPDTRTRTTTTRYNPSLHAQSSFPTLFIQVQFITPLRKIKQVSL